MNSNRVSSVVSAMGKVIAARILPGTDLIEGIEAICRNQQVDSGFIVSGIGSLQHATIVYVVPDTSAPTGASYATPRKVDGPLELVSLQGTIGRTKDQGVAVHAHGMVVGPDMKIWGGHLIVSGNPVLVTGEIMICPTPDISLVKRMDPETCFELFKLHSTKGDKPLGG